MATNTTVTQTALPDWYTQYAQNVLGRAYSATSEPYQAYGAPRVAGFAPEQEQAFGMARANIGNYQPYISAAGEQIGQGTESWAAPGVAARYMNPYTEQVVSGIGSTAARNLYENILPQINRTFIGGGTFGGSRSADFMGRAVRDTQAQALAKQAELMQQGYTEAQKIQAAEAGRALTAAPLIAGLGTQLQKQAGTDAAAMEAIGLQRQQLGQKSADLAYQDFLAQRNYPYEQVQKLAAIGGTPSAGGAGSTSTTAPGPSTAQQIGGLAGTAIGAIGATGGFGSGGWLTNLFKKDGGHVSMREARIANAKAGLGWLKDKR